MKHLTSVYVHRYDEKNHSWRKSELSGVLVSGTVEAFNLSDTLGRDAYITIRVMGDTDADVSPQDVISFEASDKAEPDDVGTAVVVSVTKNNRGSKTVRHTKIICK